MKYEQFLHNVLNDLRVELADEFDRNFERKAFFDRPWAITKRPISRGSLMMRTGALRQSIQGSISGSSIVFSSSLPYAALHNEGGTLTVTPAMKRYFWAKYYEAMGGVTNRKDGTASKTKKNAALTAEAMYWKGLALMKIGAKITIPQRQFIGHHPRVDEIVEQVVDANMQELADELGSTLQEFAKGNRRRMGR